MKIALDPKINTLDPFCGPSPWNNEQFNSISNSKKNLKVGILNDSPLFPCSDAVKRAMKLTETALIDLGY